MKSWLECVGAQIYHEAKLTERLTAAAAERLHRNLGLVATVTLALVGGGLLLSFLEGVPHPELVRQGIAPDAIRSLLTLSGAGLLIAGYHQSVLGQLYRLWVTRRQQFAGIALAGFSGILLSPGVGLSLISLAPLVMMAALSPAQAATPACAAACARPARRTKGKRCP